MGIGGPKAEELNLKAVPHVYTAESMLAERDVPFVERIQDIDTRDELAQFVSTSSFYGALNYGQSMEEALNLGMLTATNNREFLDELASQGASPDFTWPGYTWPESKWHEALDTMVAGIRPRSEPGKIRKVLASLVLRTEFHTKSGRTIPLTLFSKRSQENEDII